MESTYEKEVVIEACERLERTKGVKIKAVKVEVKENQNPEYLWDHDTVKVFITLMIKDTPIDLSCGWDKCHDPAKAIKLPLVDTLVDKELIGKIDKRQFVVLCFAAWFWIIGKHYKYF